ncbi:MAG: MarR family winged helix-turn-helix transcriptional regulator [Candidatus Nanopelagicales bacterium]|jgi:DNA-binding MarR family transcriptional regulator
MQQATDLVAAARKNRRALIEADHDALLAELAASPATASLLTALVDLMRDARRRGATQSGGGQLLVVLAKDGPRCGADLASALHLDQSTVSRQISALEAEGLVRRRASARDRRVHELELTDDGRRVAREEIQRRVRLLEAGVAGWAEEDIDTLSRLLARFVAGLRSAEEGPRSE